MAISYTEKGIGMFDAIATAGHWLKQVNGVWQSSNDTAVQAIINGYSPLAAQKAERIGLIKADGLTRINGLFSAITSLDEIAWYAEQWLSVAPAARAATTNFQKVIDIYTAAKTAITSVNAATTKAQIDAVTVNWPA
jgi:hypothetical protein